MLKAVGLMLMSAASSVAGAGNPIISIPLRLQNGQSLNFDLYEGDNIRNAAQKFVVGNGALKKDSSLEKLSCLFSVASLMILQLET